VPESDKDSTQSRDEQKERWRLRVNQHSPLPLWTQIARELRRRIAEWSLPVGHALPSVQFLADQQGIPSHEFRTAYGAMQAAGHIDSRDGQYFVAQAVPMEYVQVLPGSKITAPAADPDMDPDLPPWLVVGLRVEAPGGLDPIWYDATRVTLIVS
jgi:hypothetical protein